VRARTLPAQYEKHEKKKEEVIFYIL